tara:strand:+ start:185 stop:361 length:177 start_codon:yes stop_codon:yes gene_type:complete
VLQNIISSDIGIADLNNDGISDIIIYGYNKIGTQQGLFLNTYRYILGWRDRYSSNEYS